MECSRYFHAHTIVPRVLLFFFLLFYSVSSVQAELLLTAPPRESAAEGQAQYGPLADQLSEILGEKVTYEQPKGWLYYQRDIRADKYDIVFDGPHFMSWRIKQFGHTPVAKLPGQLEFVIVASKDNLAINSVKDLVNIPVCSIAPPNLSTLTVLAHMNNPVRTPGLVSTSGGMEDVYSSFREGKCEAAILLDTFLADEVPEKERAALKTIYKSEPVANEGVTVSSRVSAEKRALIADALTQAIAGIQPTLKRFAPEAEKMQPASIDEYATQHKLLTNVIFGWEITNPNTLAARAHK